MNIQDLYQPTLIVSSEKFKEIQQKINNYNQNTIGNEIELKTQDLNNVTTLFKNFNTEAEKIDLKSNTLLNPKSWSWANPDFDKKVKEAGLFLQQLITNAIKDRLKPSENSSLTLLVYSNPAEYEDFKDAFKVFLENIKNIDNDYTKGSDLFDYINYSDGTLVNFKLENELTKKINWIKTKINKQDQISPTPAPGTQSTPSSAQSERDKALELAIWLLRESNNIKRYMVDRYGFDLLSEASITVEDFNIMTQKENFQLLLTGLEPGEIKYLLDTFINDNPTNSTAMVFRVALGNASSMSEDEIYQKVKTLTIMQGISDDLVKKFAKALKSSPKLIGLPPNLPPKSPNPPVFSTTSGTPTPPAPTPSTPAPSLPTAAPTPSSVPSSSSTSGATPPKISPGPEKADKAPTGPRSKGDVMRPISPKGGPTYYIRTSPGRYRPAVQADMNANIPLYIKNPNSVAALVNPYVRVADEVKKARRAGPVDQKAVDKEMKAQGYQRVGPGGLRKEKDGSVRRKSQFGGAIGSLSNFLGDVGNTLDKGSRGR